jgi:hypothetical protein
LPSNPKAHGRWGGGGEGWEDASLIHFIIVTAWIEGQIIKIINKMFIDLISGGVYIRG